MLMLILLLAAGFLIYAYEERQSKRADRERCAEERARNHALLGEIERLERH